VDNERRRGLELSETTHEACATMPKADEASLRDDPVDRLKAMILKHQGRTLNEADTRHRVIDFILHDLLAWPRNRVSVEEYIAPGYADYVLKKSNGDPLLFVEAKKEGIYFELPQSVRKDEQSAYISIGKLLSDAAIKAAMQQVRTYCLDTGCEFACVTNGHEWILFKIFERGKSWESLQAFVIRSLSFFELEYTAAYNALSFTAITERHALSSLLTNSPSRDRSIFYAKDRIPSYAHSITANRLATTLRPIVNYYFGVIGDDDSDFMERCYVSQRDYQQTFDGMRTLIEDALSPYFAAYGVQQLDETGKGGRLGGRLTKNIKKGRKGEVLVLFGGKGSGKSTFIKRLLHHNPPRWLRDHSVVAIIDLLKTPDDTEVIRAGIWDTLVFKLDVENILSADRSTVLEKLFSDRFEVANRQELSGLPRASERYNSKLNELVAAWKLDKRYCARRLVDYWKESNVGVVIVVDNTDQYSGQTQDFCFSSAQEIAEELGCITLISMREERFFNSKIHGVLDAFQNAGFHISSPKPAEVFRRRLNYTISLLDNPATRREIAGATDENQIDDCVRYMGIVSREFSSEQSPLNSFLTACAHGDTRHSLDLFRSFLLSGYTNVEEMLAAGRWNFQLHQVIKPVMTPTRYFYDEMLSDIPNIYQLRFSRHSSHFTSMRILRKLVRNIKDATASYTAISELKAYFSETFNMLDDFERNVGLLLKHGFVEADNRLDSYSDSVDSIKVTGYGAYMFSGLAYSFTYLDLVCTDTGIYSEEVSNYLVEAAKEEYALFLRRDKFDRVETRLRRVETFVRYLHEEEMREREVYSLGMAPEDMFTFKCKEAFEAERARVVSSAQKQVAKARRASRRPRSH
jgi:GTPase SAR1 family protein